MSTEEVIAALGGALIGSGLVNLVNFVTHKAWEILWYPVGLLMVGAVLVIIAS